MGMYKIKNLTDSFGKRDADYNKIVSFNVSNGLIKKTITIAMNKLNFLRLHFLNKLASSLQSVLTIHCANKTKKGLATAGLSGYHFSNSAKPSHNVFL